MNTLRIFGLGCPAFANGVVEELGKLSDRYGRKYVGTKLNKHTEFRQPDGEVYTASLDNVRGADVFVISSIFGDEFSSVDEKLMKVLIFIHTLRHASAGRITLVAPYLPYMRQDRKVESRSPIATQAIAIMCESLGMHRLLTMDVHNLGAEQNAFRVPMDNLEGRKLLAGAVAETIKDLHKEKYGEKYKVLTPDAGGAARTKAFQHSLSRRIGEHVDIVYSDKRRINGNKVKVDISGDVRNANVIIVDDLISTGGTLAQVEQGVLSHGGTVFAVVATHGLYVNGAPEKLKNIPRIYTTDTVDPFRLRGTDIEKRLRIVPTAKMFAEAILRIHEDNGSISELLEDE